MIFWKPWYLYRPRQILLRLVRGRTAGPQTVQLPWGLPLRIDPGQMIGRSIWRTGVHDLLVSEAIFRLVDEGDLVVDAGANIGYMSSILGLCAGRRGELLGFEPHPEVFRQLQANVSGFQRWGSFASVRLYESALSERDGKADLFLPRRFVENDGAASLVDGGGGLTRIPISILRLDTVLGGRPVGLIKIDVEGHEEQVLRGGEKALSNQSIRDILYEDFHGAGGAVCRLLAVHGYTLFRLDRRMNGVSLRPIESAGKPSSEEAPSYLATRQPGRALQRCAAGGWRALRSA
jgi:FkbM family methyltransferase